MKNFGQTLFGGSKFIRWTLTPFILLFAISMPFLIEKWTPKILVILFGIEFLCLTMFAGFWLPKRFGRWAFRIVGGVVFLAYSAYLINEFFFADNSFQAVESRAKESPRNALLGIIFIGLPSLWFALFGRFTLRKENPKPVAEPSESDEDW